MLRPYNGFSDVLAIIAISVIVAGIVISETLYYGKDGMRDMWNAAKSHLRGTGRKNGGKKARKHDRKNGKNGH